MRNDFDYSSVSCFQTCQRRYEYRYERGLVSKHRSMAPEFGQGIHSALDVWYQSKEVPEAKKAFDSVFKEDLTLDEKRTQKMAYWILDNYDKRYRDQPIKLVHSEIAFKLDFGEGKFIGRIDKIIEWAGALWVMDHKTTSQLGAGYFKMVEPNLQLAGYVKAARLMGYNVVGVMLDAILVAKGLLDSSSRARLTPLARFDAYVSEQQLQEWEEVFGGIAEDIRRAQKLNRFVPNFSACTYYGECPYRKACMDCVLRDRILETEYVIDHWNPAKEQE